MPVEIQEVTSTVRSVDGQSLLSPRLLQAIVDAVTKALRDGDERDKRAMSERKITDGVSAERDEAR